MYFSLLLSDPLFINHSSLMLPVALSIYHPLPLLSLSLSHFLSFSLSLSVCLSVSFSLFRSLSYPPRMIILLYKRNSLALVVSRFHCLLFFTFFDFFFFLFSSSVFKNSLLFSFLFFSFLFFSLFFFFVSLFSYNNLYIYIFSQPLPTNPVGWGSRIRRLYLCRRERPPLTSVLNMTQN